MKVIRKSGLLAVIFGLGLAATAAQEKGKETPQAGPQHEMTTLYMVFLIRSPQATSQQFAAVRKAHIDYRFKLVTEDKDFAAGPFLDGGKIAGIAISRAASAAEAKAWEEGDPAVEAGLLSVEIHPWYTAKGIFKKPSGPIDISKLKKYHIVFLSRGPSWTAEHTADGDRLQEAHMANIHKMAAAGKLITAGPFSDDGQLRGVFLFRTETVEETKALCDADPAVQAGRLIADIHPWLAPGDALP